MTLWQKGYELDQQVVRFTVGDEHRLDLRLVSYDCQASSAHARMLAKVGILSKAEAERLVKALDQLRQLAEDGKFEIRQDQEDCHTAIEQWLTERLGELGKKIHTARSRNDQVLAALRLYYRAQLAAVESACRKLMASEKQFSKRFGRIAIPGYTHTRPAMPTTVAIWIGAFREAALDNLKLLSVAGDLADQSPLGAGAGYGVPIVIDRAFTAKQLGFKRVQRNPLYTQNSRGKIEATMLHALSQIMFDLNKLSADLILFSMTPFEIFKLPKEFCTGSSIMPNKLNPDLLELIRAKYHQIVAAEVELKSLTSNLISGYHRDFALTKEPVMRAFDTTLASLQMMTALIERLEVDREKAKTAMTDELYATERAYELVTQGMSFRDAYREIGKSYGKK